MNELTWKEKFNARLEELKYEHSYPIINEDEYYEKLKKLNELFFNENDIENPKDIEVFVNDENIPRKMSIIDYKTESKTEERNIYASVALKDNKILFWKISGNPKREIIDWYKDCYFSGLNMNDLMEDKSVKCECKTFVVNDENNNYTFEVLARDWFKQWEIIETFKGSKPY